MTTPDMQHAVVLWFSRWGYISEAADCKSQCAAEPALRNLARQSRALLPKSQLNSSLRQPGWKVLKDVVLKDPMSDHASLLDATKTS